MSGPKVFKNANDARRAGVWFGAVAGSEWAKSENKLPITKAAAESVNSTGGVLVPSLISDAIIELRDVRGVFRSATGGGTPVGESNTIPRRTGGLTAYFTAENAAITESSAAWDNISFATKKLATLTRSSSELDEDSAANFGEVLTREIAYAFAAKEDDCGFNGTGASTYGGIRGVTQILIDGNHSAGRVAATSGHDTFAEIDGTDLGNLIAALPAYALPTASWFVSNYGYATTFCRLAASSGGIVSMTVNGVVVPTFLGFPVKLTPVLPQVGTTLQNSIMMLFGDLSLSSTLGDRRGIAIAQSAERYLDQDQIAWRGTERVDIVNHDLGDNTTAGPVVGLMGN